MTGPAVHIRFVHQYWFVNTKYIHFLYVLFPRLQVKEYYTMIQRSENTNFESNESYQLSIPGAPVDRTFPPAE